MKLLINETTIIESGNRQLVLTDKRIRYYEGNSQNSNFTSILLHKISGVEVAYKAKFWLLILGIITLPILVGLLLIGLYFYTRKHVVAISSDGGTVLTFQTKGMKRAFVEDFINELEAAVLYVNDYKPIA